jgi:hypothetical protein
MVMDFSKWIKLINQETTGSLQIHISNRYFEKDPGGYAKKLFFHYGLSELPFQNGALVYLNRTSRRYVLVLGEGLLAKIEKNYAQALNLALKEDLQSTHYENAIRITLLTLGETLKTVFPKQLKT